MIIQQSGHALGTKVVFTLNAANEASARTVLSRLKTYLHLFEQRLSRFLPSSDVTTMNLSKGKYVPIDTLTREFFVASNDMQTWSEGFYDPFVLPDLQRAGYLHSLTNSYPKTATPDVRNFNASHTNHRVDVSNYLAKIAPGTAFDSGGLGKGYALDALANIIEERRIADYWISLGGDVIAAGHDENGKPWKIALDMINATPAVEIGEGRWAIATSSVARRRGKNWHHLIDPQTGKPSQSSTLSVSVVAQSGAEADIAAKSLLLADGEARGWWERHSLHRAYLQRSDGLEVLV
ncbi:MAG TPA: FAD:protein FMN transferase [Candidatus Saccharibacteria bacterium]|nr:FAD:protein FMN transferase [Candidatus Saccharibacteria bacterium]